MHEAVPDADRGAPVKAHVPVAGGRLFVRVWPGGTPERAPIILFHDSLGCVHLWRSFPASLARQTGRTVVAYDRLGFGRSDPHPSRLAFDFIASEGPSALGPVLDALAIDRWIGFGHSVGGGMALCAATSVPGCLATITEAAQSFVERRTTDGIRDAMRGFTAPGGLDRIARYHGSKAAWVLASWTDTWLDAGFGDWSLDTTLVTITTPVLAIHGELDEYGSTAHPERITRLARGPTRLAAMSLVTPREEYPRHDHRHEHETDHLTAAGHVVPSVGGHRELQE